MNEGFSRDWNKQSSTSLWHYGESSLLAYAILSTDCNLVARDLALSSQI